MRAGIAGPEIAELELCSGEGLAGQREKGLWVDGEVAAGDEI